MKLQSHQIKTPGERYDLQWRRQIQVFTLHSLPTQTKERMEVALA